MTNELEKIFFDTFGLEPKWGTVCNHCDCQEFEKSKFYYFDKGICCGCHHSTDGFYYPQITDHILLELICICNSTYINGYTNYFMATGKTKEGLKEEILKKCIALSKDIKHQVRTLFGEW